MFSGILASNLKWMNEAFYSFFNVGRTEENFGEDNHFSVFTQFKMFSQLVQSSCSCSTKHTWLWTQTVALAVHDFSVSWTSAASPVKWVQDCPAALAFKWPCPPCSPLCLLCPFVLLFGGGGCSCLFLCYSVRQAWSFISWSSVDK